MSSQETTLPSPGGAMPDGSPRPRTLWFAIGALTLLVAGLTSALVWKGKPAPVEAVPPAMSQKADALPEASAKVTAPNDGLEPKAPAAPVAHATPAPKAHKKVAKADDDAELPAPAAQRPAPAPVCADCGVIESVQAVTHKGDGSGVGAVAGGVLGGAIGNQVGRGDGRKAMTVIGAIGGGLAGHEIEKRAKSTTAYLVKLRMDDGSTRSVEQSSAPAVGQRVRVEGKALQPIS